MFKERRHKPRFRPISQLMADVRSLGASGFYRFRVEDLSESGCLLSAGETATPFTMSSIIEVRLLLAESDPIEFMAKLARLNVGQEMGLRIVQIDERNRHRLFDLLRAFSEDSEVPERPSVA